MAQEPVKQVSITESVKIALERHKKNSIETDRSESHIQRRNIRINGALIIMSEQQDAWVAGQQGMWQNCPRYGIMVTGCSRYFVCFKNSIQACLEAFGESKIQNHSCSNNVLVPSHSITKTRQIFTNKGVKILGD